MNATGNSVVSQRRKAPPSGPRDSTNQLVLLSSQPQPQIANATVLRKKWGTGPFDENWLNVDCCGLFCALMTYGLHVFGCYAVCVVLIPPWMSYIGENGVRIITTSGQFHRISFCSVAAIASASHFKAMTTDPGAVPPDAKPLPDPEENGEQKVQNETSDDDVPLVKPTNTSSMRGRRLCRRCNTFKPARAHHCSVCKRCIIKMDHHCPWVNNCVGIGNHKYFLLFIFYTCISCMYSMSLVVSRFFICMGDHSEHAGGSHHRSRSMHCLDEPTQLLTIVGLVVEAMLFGLFTACMMFDQWDVVTTSMTHIDRLKGNHIGKTTKDRVPGTVEVFGMGHRREKHGKSGVRPHWLSPFANVCFPQHVRDDIYGFCRPCLHHNESDVELNQSGTRAMRAVPDIV